MIRCIELVILMHLLVPIFTTQHRISRPSFHFPAFNHNTTIYFSVFLFVDANNWLLEGLLGRFTFHFQYEKSFLRSKTSQHLLNFYTNHFTSALQTHLKTFANTSIFIECLSSSCTGLKSLIFAMPRRQTLVRSFPPWNLLD
jgi:hypothetical protein